MKCNRDEWAQLIAALEARPVRRSARRPAIELQHDAGDLAQLPWLGCLADTIEGGEGCCLHATMRQVGDNHPRAIDQLSDRGGMMLLGQQNVQQPRATPGSHAWEQWSARFVAPCEHWPATQ